MGPRPAPVPILTLLLLLGAVANAQPRGRILGGSEAVPHLQPYMASLQLDGQHVCGGLLIAEQWVLSAAHCTEGTAWGGQHDAGLHPADPRSLFARWQLEEKAELNEHVQVLPFQREDRDVEANIMCEAMGWGTISHSGRRPDRLQSVERPVISRELCNHRTRHDNTITEKMMCTDSRKKDTCKGDSGGPLVCNGVAEGVVTAGSRVCGNYKKPAIYTRIAPYAAWIDSVMASTDGN
ncbi:CFAD factor, partial [Penelope pileata]|nr:CFAD factor [Penelope pileata]